MWKPAKKLSNFLGNLIKGIALPAQVYTVRDYTYPHKSTQDALLSDLEKIEGDFKKVIEREKAKVRKL